MKLTQARYNAIRRQLNSPSDVDAVAAKEGIPHSTLLSIMAHKMVRETMGIFYRVKARSKELHSDYENGKSITEISQMCKLAPTLCASFIFEQKGFNKKSFRHAVKNPGTLEDARLQKELIDAIKSDFIYSDWAAEEQRARGELHERNLEKWLAKQQYEFWTEKDRAGHEKTPDFLLKKAVMFQGREVHWFESKGYFGDSWEIDRNYKKQLREYVELFGQGVVIYWLGFVTDAKLPSGFSDNIILIDDEDLL